MTLLYDGDCRFCTDGVEWFRRTFDPAAESRPWREGEEADAVQWVDGTKRAAGADAVAAWLRSSRRNRWIVPLIPVGLPFGRLLYPLVARHRGRLGMMFRR